MKNGDKIVLTAIMGLLLPFVAQAAPAQPPATHAPAHKPLQSAVAAKTAFAIVPASSTPVKKALDAHNLAAAQKMLGKPGAFQGTVTSVYSPRSHGLVILDFDKEYKTAMTAVVMSGGFARFPDLAALEGKHVLVTSTFTAPKGKPQINLTDPAQIKIIH